MIELVCCDMAGTTVKDDGLVLEAFQRTLDSLDLDAEEVATAHAFVIETMGQSKIEVFRTLFGERASIANELFEHTSSTPHARSASPRYPVRAPLSKP